jgi:serine/threonine protein kinase
MGRAAELQAGELFAGRYEVQQLLGEGERKKTFLARDTKFDRLVALAIAKPEGVEQDPTGIEREARILGRIGSHDNIVSVFDYDFDAGSNLHYIVFEYLSGGRLIDLLRTGDPQSPEKLLLLARQVCRGMAHLHEAGIIHRDVSPANVFFDQRGNAHVGDFDSAISVEDPFGVRPITTNRFASPEELEGKPLDIRSDLYSFGALLYVAATGQERLRDLLTFRRLRPDLPTSFADLLESCVAYERDDRPADTEAVLRWLGDIRQASDLDTLLAAEESETIEYKSSLLHGYGDPDPDLEALMRLGTLTSDRASKITEKRLQWSVTKTVAAFLNTHGGTLLIGVDDKHNVVGIEADFAHLGKNQDSDAWLLSLHDLVLQRLGADVWNAMRTSLVTHQDRTVAIITCPRRSIETWHHGGVVDSYGGVDKEEHFYVRTGNATDEVKGPELVKWIREHW